METLTSLARSTLIAGLALVLGCSTSNEGDRSGSQPPGQVIRYVGSSTIANFIEDAAKVYTRASFSIDIGPESLGGERLIRAGKADLAGLATEPAAETFSSGLRATLIASDTIAVIVNQKNPVTQVTLEQLRKIYTGEIVNWSEIGGPHLEIVPMIVEADSATHRVFRSIVLGKDDYRGCRTVTPDPHMPLFVEEEPGAIGTISHSFLCRGGGNVKVLLVEGDSPVPWNPHYRIVRPLYLLWWPDRPGVQEFINWTRSEDGIKVLTQCFGERRKLNLPLGVVDSPR